MCLRNVALKRKEKIQQTIVKVEEFLGREMYSALLKRHSFGQASASLPGLHSPT